MSCIITKVTVFFFLYSADGENALISHMQHKSNTTKKVTSFIKKMYIILDSLPNVGLHVY